MALQNRVLPTGDIVAIPQRGLLTGNRGILHVADRTMGNRRWSHHAWICCTLDWQGRKRDVMTGRKWTELFFLDEAVAFAAGHRPCGYCRRPAYRAYKSAWGGAPGAKDMDAALHSARVEGRAQRRTPARLGDLPDGVFVLRNDLAMLWHHERLWAFGTDGYKSGPIVSKSEQVWLLTPEPNVNCLRNGYKPRVHPTAKD